MATDPFSLPLRSLGKALMRASMGASHAAGNLLFYPFFASIALHLSQTLRLGRWLVRAAFKQR